MTVYNEWLVSFTSVVSMAPVVSFFTPRHNKVRPINLDLALKLVLQISNSRCETLLVLVCRTMPIQEGVMALDPNQIKSRFFLWLFKHLIAYVVYSVNISCCWLLCFRFHYILVTDTLKNAFKSNLLVFFISFCQPFENKWSRFSPINNISAPASRQSDNQPPAANHKWVKLMSFSFLRFFCFSFFDYYSSLLMDLVWMHT